MYRRKMRQLFAAIPAFLVLSTLAVAQPVVQKKDKVLEYIEEYSVLASNKKVRHRTFKKYRLDASQIWTGKIDKGEKVGEWSYYDNGELDQTYNYDEKKLVFQGKTVAAHFVQVNDVGQVKTLDAAPTYLGSKIELADELNKVLQYPTKAKRMGVEGLVTVGIWINEDNSLGKIELISGIMKECDEALVDALKKVPGNWFAGITGGKPVVSNLILTVEYRLVYTFQNAAVTIR